MKENIIALACAELYRRTGRNWEAGDVLTIPALVDALGIEVELRDTVATDDDGEPFALAIPASLSRVQGRAVLTLHEACTGRGAATRALLGATVAIEALEAVGFSGDLRALNAAATLVGHELERRASGRDLSIEQTGSTPGFHERAIREAEARSRKERPRDWRRIARNKATVRRAFARLAIGGAR